MLLVVFGCMCVLSARALNLLVHINHGNTDENIWFTFSNVTSARGKSPLICDMAERGAHFIAESWHDDNVMQVINGEAAAHRIQRGAYHCSYEFIYGDTPTTSGHAGVAACFGPRLNKRARRVLAPAGSNASKFERAGRLIIPHGNEMPEEA